VRRNKVMGAVKAALFKRSRRLSSVELGFAQEVLVWQGVLGRFRRGWLGLVRCVTVSHGGLGFGMAWRVPVSRGKFRRSSRGLAR